MPKILLVVTKERWKGGRGSLPMESVTLVVLVTDKNNCRRSLKRGAVTALHWRSSLVVRQRCPVGRRSGRVREGSFVVALKNVLLFQNYFCIRF